MQGNLESIHQIMQTENCESILIHDHLIQKQQFQGYQEEISDYSMSKESAEKQKLKERVSINSGKISDMLKKQNFGSVLMTGGSAELITPGQADADVDMT